MAVTRSQHPRREKRRKILVIDVGGSHVKMKLSTGSKRRQFKSGPKLTAEDLVAKVKKRTKKWTYDRISIGYPGPVAGNRAIAEPHNLGTGWVGFNFAKAFRRPVRLVNDAVMQALGSYRGGRMLFLGLGTGLGLAMIIDGVIEPMELAHLPYKKGKSFEYFLGSEGMKRFGLKKWRGYVADAVEKLWAALEPEYIVIGGGNARKLKTLPPHALRGANARAFDGGVRLWDQQPTATGQ
jgi:polyphosphate glucokinase